MCLLPIFEEWRKSMQTSEKISNIMYRKRSFSVQMSPKCVEVASVLKTSFVPFSEPC